MSNSIFDTYTTNELNDMFSFIKEHAEDVTYYKNHKNKKFEISKIDSMKFKKNKEYNVTWIINQYEELIETYATLATDKIIEFIINILQSKTKKINRNTLDLLVKLFGKNILEDINGDYTIETVKKVIFLNLVSEEKFRNTAYLIAKDDTINLAINSRIQYVPSRANTLDSKEFALSIINHSLLGTDKDYKARIERDFVEQYKAYMDASEKKWKNCLEGERHRTYLEWINGEKLACIPFVPCKKNEHHRTIYEEWRKGEKRSCVPNSE